MRNNGFYTLSPETSIHEIRLRQELFSTLAVYQYEEEKQVILDAICDRLPDMVEALVAGINMRNLHPYHINDPLNDQFDAAILSMNFHRTCSKLERSPTWGATQIFLALPGNKVSFVKHMLSILETMHSLLVS